MKKVFAVLMTMVLLLCSGAAVAEVVEWEESPMSAMAQQIDPNGQFVEIPVIGLKMWVPSALEVVPLTEEDMAYGYIGYLTTADQSSSVIINCYEPAIDLEDELETIENGSGYSGVSLDTVNGISVLSYVRDDRDDMQAIIEADIDGVKYEVVFSFAPYSNEAFQIIAALMVASIMPV